MNSTEFIIEPARQDIIMTRVFDAPPDMVFRAYTDPKLIPDWWGPAKYRTTVDRADVMSGGSWRFVSSDDVGNEYGFHGIFHDVVPSERIVQTFEFEGNPGHVSLETATFEEMAGRTKYVAVSVYQSVEDRDGMVQSGMEAGAREGMDRLAALVERLRM